MDKNLVCGLVDMVDARHFSASNDNYGCYRNGNNPNIEKKLIDSEITQQNYPS